uniref:Uncharacterized protein n=1 Tax=Setaria digitata TaxID=48799 RepID=A0A915PUQ8_9BILA
MEQTDKELPRKRMLCPRSMELQRMLHRFVASIVESCVSSAPTAAVLSWFRFRIDCLKLWGDSLRPCHLLKSLQSCLCVTTHIFHQPNEFGCVITRSVLFLFVAHFDSPTKCSHGP